MIDTRPFRSRTSRNNWSCSNKFNSYSKLTIFQELIQELRGNHAELHHAELVVPGEIHVGF